ncbi:MAG: hypothetical protein KIT43_05045 [Bauldia sp.]|nr:hypothetical protein [Bauldia sp.]
MWASLATLAVVEIVSGIDDVVFFPVIVARLSREAAKRIRQVGLLGALGFRVLLLLTWLIGLDQALFNAFGRDITWRDLILLAGGLFLVVKATLEIHQGVEGDEEAPGRSGSAQRTSPTRSVITSNAGISARRWRSQSSWEVLNVLAKRTQARRRVKSAECLGQHQE